MVPPLETPGFLAQDYGTCSCRTYFSRTCPKCGHHISPGQLRLREVEEAFLGECRRGSQAYSLVRDSSWKFKLSGWRRVDCWVQGLVRLSRSECSPRFLLLLIRVYPLLSTFRWEPSLSVEDPFVFPLPLL